MSLPPPQTGPEISEQSATTKPSTLPPPFAPSPLVRLLGTMASVAAGFFLVLKVGFIIHHDPQPALIQSNILTAIAILVLLGAAVAVILLAIQSVSRAASKARLQEKTNQIIAARAEARRRRAAELAADPARARYAPLVARGEDWSDEQIAYDENPGKTATCEHLQAIETAMRGAGIEMRLSRESVVTAKCRIDIAALNRDFSVTAPVRYAAFYAGNRYDSEHPMAFIICDEHKSRINTLHPDETGASNAPGFPPPGPRTCER